MERYLVFDASCSTCATLAKAVREATGGKLEVISIYSDQAKSLLTQAFPKGWQHAPYLAIVDSNQVRAWTGLQLALRLGWLMGPHQAWRVWASSRRYGVFFLPGVNIPPPLDASRRRFLKLAVGVATVTGLRGYLSASTVLAVECGCHACRWTRVAWYCTDICPDQPAYPYCVGPIDFEEDYYCLDRCTGEVCNSRATVSCCTC